MCAERLSASPLAVARPRLCRPGVRPRVARRAVAGQALVETVVGAIVLVPLVLLVVWLGKVHSVRQATIAASRTVAFECAVRPDACADTGGHAGLADEIRRRAFGRIDASILSAERMPADAAAAERNPLWTDRAGRPLLERFADVGVRVDRPRFDAGESLAHSRAGGIVADAATMLADQAGPGRFGLAIAEGLVDARIQVNLSASRTATDFRSQLDSIPLRIHARTAVLTDAWNASGPYGDDPHSVESRVERGRQLLAAYDASIDARYLLTRGFIGLMGAIGLEPAADAFRYHDADVDVVPPDRLGGSGELPGYAIAGPGSSDDASGP